MQETITVQGQDVNLATITVEALEAVELAGKTGLAWNKAFIAASIRASGDAERGTAQWVGRLEAYGPKGSVPPFRQVLDAAKKVNGLEDPPPGEDEPVAPAAE